VSRIILGLYFVLCSVAVASAQRPLTQQEMLQPYEAKTQPDNSSPPAASTPAAAQPTLEKMLKPYEEMLKPYEAKTRIEGVSPTAAPPSSTPSSPVATTVKLGHEGPASARWPVALP
jgi:hypothetical protein